MPPLSRLSSAGLLAVPELGAPPLQADAAKELHGFYFYFYPPCLFATVDFDEVTRKSRSAGSRCQIRILVGEGPKSLIDSKNSASRLGEHPGRNQASTTREGLPEFFSPLLARPSSRP